MDRLVVAGATQHAPSAERPSVGTGATQSLEKLLSKAQSSSRSCQGRFPQECWGDLEEENALPSWLLEGVAMACCPVTH